MFKKRGFSLIEVLFSLTILGLGLLALFGMFNISLRANSMQSNQATARNILSSVLGETRQSAVSDIPPGSKEKFWSSDYPSLGDEPFEEGDIKVGKTKFHFRVFTRTVLSGSSSKNRLKEIEVKVTWWGSQKTGYGQLESTSSLMVAEL